MASDYFAAAKGGPVCSQHRIKLDRIHGLKPYFKCGEENCKEEAHYDPPICEKCLKPMKLLGTRQQMYYWRCEDDRLSQQFHKEIRSVGDSSRQGPPPECPRHKCACVTDENCNDTTQLHFTCPRDCEYHVVFDREKCEDCGEPMLIVGGPWWFGWKCENSSHRQIPFVMCCCEGKGWDHYDSDGVGMNIQRCDSCRIFEDDDEAAQAHHKICQCELSPKNIEKVMKELNRWGRHFQEALGQPITITTTEMSEEDIRKRMEHFMGDFERQKHIQEQVRRNAESLDTPMSGLKPGELYIEKSRSYPASTRKGLARVPCIFTDEQMASAGFKPMKREDGSIVTGKSGRPHGFLVEIPPVLSPGKMQDVKDLCKATYNLLGQLNDMRFDTFSIKDQQRLESVRRATLAALRLVEKDVGTKDSVERDKLATVLREKFSLAGGFRVVGLEKLDDEEVLQGKCFLDGILHHVQFIRVREVDGVQEAVLDPHDRFRDLGELNDGMLRTTQVPGFEGDYVLVIYPTGR